MNHSADVNDNASELESLFREAAIQDVRIRMTPPKEFDGEHCTECDVAIVQGRLALGFYTCVECQSAIEKRKRFYRS